MKNLFLLCLFAGAASLASSAFAETGGITGGGGGITNPNPAGKSLIYQSVNEARPFLHAYLNAQEASWLRSKAVGHDDETGTFLFDRKDDVFQYLAKATIEVHGSVPCHDGDGKEVDASVYAEAPGAICLSVFNLGNKLSQFNYEYETVALILHEIVHQMGGDEAMAVKIQVSAVNSLVRLSAGEEAGYYDLLRKHLGEVRWTLDQLKYTVEQPNVGTYDGVQEELLQARDNTSLRTFALYPLRASQRDFFEGQLLKLSVLGDYVQSIANRDGSAQWFRQRYLKGFGDNSEISVADYFRNRDEISLGTGREVFISRITSLDVWREELDEMSAALSKTQDVLEKLSREYFPVISR